MPATRTSSARPSTVHAESEPYPAQPGPFARTEGATWPATPAYCTSLTQGQADGVTEDHMPNHCSAPYSSNRSTWVNPSFAATRIERSLAVWVLSTTGSLGCAPANQSSAAAHASAGVPASPCLRQEHVAEIDLPGIRTHATRMVCVRPVERDRADHRSVEIDHEKARPPPGRLSLDPPACIRGVVDQG